MVLEVREADVEAQPIDQRLRLRRSEVFDASGETVWRVTYEDYRFVADPAATGGQRRGVAMPFRIRFEDPSRGVDTLVRMREIELNAEVPEDTFVQEPGPALGIQEVRCE
jgi:outer membrane lipoprotein-sorting protein